MLKGLKDFSMAFEYCCKNQFQFLADVPSDLDDGTRPLHVLFLADDRHPANVVQDHIQSFSRLSRHKITLANPRVLSTPDILACCPFDALLIHYSIFILAETYLPSAWQDFVARFSGAKAIIHEDEYQDVNNFKRKFLDLGFGAVFSCLDSPQTMRVVYGDGSLSGVLFFSCLPGYIADNFRRFDLVPIADRHFDIVYRGRTLPPQLGAFAQDKRIIGEQILSVAEKYGLYVDISSAESDRIYGDAWPEFLTSGRAMLGVEGGASIFDFDGTLAKDVDQFCFDNPSANFQEIWSALLKQHEGNVFFRTITPKFFEAIAAKTALVLYPGNYSGILQPERHYIVLERDGSNILEVVEKIRNTEYLQELVNRTYSEILSRDDLTTDFYVRQVDSVLSMLHYKIVEHVGRSELHLSRQTLASTQHALALTQQKLISTQQALALSQQELALSQQVLSSTQSEVIQLALHIDELELKLLSASYFSQLFLKALRAKMKRTLRIFKWA